MLNNEDRNRLLEEGFLIVGDVLSECTNKKIIQTLDMFSEVYPGRKSLLPSEFFLDLITSKEIIDIASSLLPPKFLFHHANGRRTDLKQAKTEKTWHHDYDGEPQPFDTRPKMVHIMIYPAGLPENVAPLAVVRGSHKKVVARHFPNQFGVEVDEDTVLLRSDKPILVVVDSSLWHMRPAAMHETARYDVNLSFCCSSSTWPERRKYSEVLSYARENSVPEHSCLFGSPAAND